MKTSMNIISLSDLNSRVKLELGEKESYNMELSMSVSEVINRQNKPTFQPFYHNKTDTRGEIEKSIKNFILNNLGASSNIITGNRDKLNKIRDSIARDLSNNKSVWVDGGGGLIRKKYVSLKIECSLDAIKNILSNRHFYIIVNIKIT